MQRRWWWWQAPPALAVAVVCHLVFALVLGLRSVGYLERLELIAYDQAVQRRADTTAKEPRIAIIGLTEKDFSQYPWPLDDETLAALIERLIGLGARAVAVDLYRDHPIPPGSERLTALLTGTANIIWGYRFADAHAPGTPPPAVRSADQTGFADQVVDRDGVVRRMLLYLEQDDTVGVSMALRMAEQFLKPLGIWPKPDPRNPDVMQLGAATYVPLDANSGGYHHIDARGYQVLLDYALGPDPFEQYSLRTVLEEPWPPDAFAERLVFIGLATDTVKDFFNTPFTSDYESVTFGVALHALETNQLLRNALDRTPLTTPLSDVSGTLWIWGWCLLGGLWGYVTTSTPRFAVGTVSGAGLLTALWYAALVNYLWIPLMPAVLGWIASATLLLAYMRRREHEERQSIMRLFSCYVSKEVAHEIWQQRNVLLARGSPQPRRLIATVLITDIEDFTSLAEGLDAHEVMKWMNVYLNAMIESVVTHGGAVIRFTNDGVVAAFGVPLFRQSEAEIDRDAGNAVDCALEISQKLMHLNTTSRVRGRPPVNLRVGIYTGPLVVGSRGSPERMEYAVIGDTVNVAERLEAFSKELPKLTGADSPCRIAVGDATWLRLRKRYLGISVGKVSLKGKEKKIEVFQVLDAGHGSIEHPPPSRRNVMRSKKSKQYFGVAIVAAFLFLVPSDPGSAAEGMQSGGEGIGSVQPVQRERQQLVYRPRAIGAPERRVGAGSRGEGERQSSKGGDLMMTVLAPKEIGLTTKPQPTLYWFSSRAISHPVNLIVIAEGSDTVTPIVNHRINGGVAAGIHQLSLEKAGVRLDPDKNYAWSVEVMVDPDQPSKNLVTTGGLRRMTPPPELQKQLKSTPLEQQPVLYAENGIWYDALEILSNNLIAAQPRNPIWHQQRAELLEQGDLPEVAEFDRHRSGG